MRRSYWLTTILCLTVSASAQQATTVRLGFFPNLTHAAALVALERGYFQKELGKVKLEAREFVAGTALNEAFAAGQIDVAYIGPGPAINGFTRGLPMQIVAGASNAGAVLVARSDVKITGVKDLAGKRVAVPSLGNTQDISLRHLLKENGLRSQTDGGNVTVVPVAPADVAAAFASKQIDAALVPEPWGALLETRGGRVVGSEKTIWRGGDYPTTLMIVNTKFAAQNPDLVKAMLRAHLAAVRFVNTSKPAAQTAIARKLKELTGESVDARVLQRALARTEITASFDLDALKEYGELNKEAGYTRTLPDWEKLVNLELLKSLGGR
ncbi:ABC transporter substrate-binding protein [Deinococcus yavapaiensis]|uniref:NitT/TauT family transport system substrate-binding protein n=1 Tax=Deinococcus yavapaiensis KR-236 TaxID=694435 RepID=A0A318SD93_9DEIO|nr:ABC transporter substrate-binding protein [Deinococcus yavapaiensis]PYE56603.1 NitT/TauT family transport system substrate-binding protein [Deinococcus yavapaiensis KR-236]